MPIRWEEMPSFLNKFGIFIDRFTIPFHTKICLEAMACGLATIDYRHNSKLEEGIMDLRDEKNRLYEGLRNRTYILMNHDARKVVHRLIGIYEELLRR